MPFVWALRPAWEVEEPACSCSGIAIVNVGMSEVDGGVADRKAESSTSVWC